MLAHPWFAIIVIVHVLVGVIGFGALAMTGAYARLASHAPQPASVPSLVRFFQPGRNLAARTILLVPIFGAIALAYSHDTHKLYPYLGLGIWFIATGIASALVWPSERRLQALFSDPTPNPAELARAAHRCDRAAMATSLCFVGALVVMIAQPA